MAAGYPLGAVSGGIIATHLLAAGNWRSVFAFGGFATAALIPLIWFLLPESISYLVQRRPARALERVNAALARFGHRSIDALPSAMPEPRRGSWLQLFEPGLARTTTLLGIAYFAHIMTFYFMLKWIPKIVVDMGFDPSKAGGVLVWTNVGGASGALVFSVLTQRIGVKRLVILSFVLTTVMVNFFGRSDADLDQLALLAACSGFFCNAAVVGIYAMLAQSFATAIRASGTGFVVGIGRGGAALGPIAAGYMFDAGANLPAVASTLALGSLVAAAAVLFMRYDEGRAL
jgi:cyanate permease